MKSLITIYWQRWISWSQDSINRRIFAATITVGGFSLIVKLVAMLKELVTAYQFGRGDELDAFLMAFLLPSFGINVIAGSFNAALIPTYIQTREKKGNLVAQQLLSSVMIWSVVMLVAVSLVLAFIIHIILPFLASGFSPQKIALTQTLFFMLLPVLVISGITTIWTSVLNAREQFAVGAFVPIIVPLVTTGFLVIFGNAWGVFSLVYGTLVGFILQCVPLALALKKQNIGLHLRWYGMTPELQKVINQYLPMVAGAFLMSSTALVDQAMAAMLDSGSVAALNYGNKIVSLVVGLGAMAIGTSVLPHFSRMVTEEDWQNIHHTLRTYTRLILLTTIPFTILLFFTSEFIVRLFFERGAFNYADTQLVGQVQAFYVLQLPFYILGMLLVRLISSLRKNRILFWGALINFPVNVVLNLFFIQLLGVAGIALSTSIVYLLSCSYLGLMIIYLLKRQGI
ncbi:MAG: murein biosynthesis integral membrane protein MurJ [Thiotrichaceae bacterium IS1]|nr:MAG: murein biosynthesis integral membrane protein MurJ [Thiotrichaceae bacterium IS1]